MINLLVLSLLVPLAGGALCWGMAVGGHRSARWLALFSSLTTLVLAGLLIARHPADVDTAQWQWLANEAGTLNFSLVLGLDGISLWLYGLTALVTVTAVLVSWDEIRERAVGFYILLMLLEFGMLGVFAAGDVITFTVFFEFTLIPLLFLIGMWGGREGRSAALTYFFYIFSGSVFTLLGLLGVVLWAYNQTGVLTFTIAELQAVLDVHPVEPLSLQMCIFLALFVGFAVKTPIFPLHSWMPPALAQGPTGGIIVGVLLKLGIYGLIRFNLPMLPDAAAVVMPWVLIAAVAGIIYGALVALVASDIRKLVAYASVSHLGYCIVGLFALNPLGIEGGMFHMVNHGLYTAGLFAVIGILCDRYKTNEIHAFRGLAWRTPVLAVMLMIFIFASIGLPGLNGFPGEFLVLVGMFQRTWTASPVHWHTVFLVLTVLSVSGVVLGAWYMLALARRTMFGTAMTRKMGESSGARDLNFRELAALLPLLFFVVWAGVQPDFFLRRMTPQLSQTAAATNAAVERIYVTEPVEVAHDQPPLYRALTQAE